MKKIKFIKFPFVDFDNTHIRILEDKEKVVEGVNWLQDRHKNVWCTRAVVEGWVCISQIKDLLAEVQAGVDEMTKAKYC